MSEFTRGYNIGHSDGVKAEKERQKEKAAIETVIDEFVELDEKPAMHWPNDSLG